MLKKKAKHNTMSRSGNWISKTNRLALYLRDEFTCSYCERSLCKASPRDVTLDHVIPVSEGGTDEPKNLVLACRRCNSRKQDKNWRHFAGNGETIRRIVNRRRRVPNTSLALEILQGRRAAAAKAPTTAR